MSCSPPLGLLQGRVQSGQLRLAAYEGPRLARSGLSTLRRGPKAIALLSHRLNIVGHAPRLAQRLAQLPDTDPQDTLTHMCLGPHMLGELLA